MVDQVMIALQMMSFEGKDIIEQKVAENGTLAQRVQALQEMCLKLATVVDSQNKTNITASLANEMSAVTPGNPANVAVDEINVDSLGSAATSGIPTADAAKVRAMNIATPR